MSEWETEGEMGLEVPVRVKNVLAVIASLATLFLFQ